MPIIAAGRDLIGADAQGFIWFMQEDIPEIKKPKTFLGDHLAGKTEWIDEQLLKWSDDQSDDQQNFECVWTFWTRSPVHPMRHGTGISATGSGKTLAYLLPCFSSVADSGPRGDNWSKEDYLIWFNYVIKYDYVYTVYI